MSAIAPSSDWNDIDDLELTPNSDWEREFDMASEDSILKTLLKYMGEYEARSEVIPIPTVNFPAQEPEKDVTNLQALMSSLVTCTIPLADLLKI